eukprot:TRINITY_DN12626_c0_g1_i1.p3 TRINITY_DN12626_c0_g1~~TRINITY_DN12626_c0_g1_i1.p3  ORF type:complete len:146 (+),score=40.55 TRINITY_DN12626_c0_g1_i1:63-440(+)
MCIRDSFLGLRDIGKKNDGNSNANKGRDRGHLFSKQDDEDDGLDFLKKPGKDQNDKDDDDLFAVLNEKKDNSKDDIKQGGRRFKMNNNNDDDLKRKQTELAKKAEKGGDDLFAELELQITRAIFV